MIFAAYIQRLIKNIIFTVGLTMSNTIPMREKTFFYFNQNVWHGQIYNEYNIWYFSW